MAEYVRKTDAMREIDRARTLTSAYLNVASMHTIDMAPVVHGRWVCVVEKYPELYGWVPLNDVVCSICDKMNGKKTTYCPNCGAIMDGEC